MSGWIGVDLDQTLAQYDGWKGAGHIGEALAPMKSIVQRALADGVEVRILTARADPSRPEYNTVVWAIEEWCKQHFGRPLKVTNTKDFSMWMLFDDRAVSVEANTGVTIFDLAGQARASLARGDTAGCTAALDRIADSWARLHGANQGQKVPK